LQNELDKNTNIGLTSGSEIENFVYLRVVISNHNVTAEYIDLYFKQLCSFCEGLLDS